MEKCVFPKKVYSPIIISARSTDPALLEVAPDASTTLVYNHHDNDDDDADENEANHAHKNVRKPINERIAVEIMKERKKE